MIDPEQLDGRHPAVRDIARYFDASHLSGDLAYVSRACGKLASQMIDDLPDCPQLTTGLQHLLAAKDAFVRAALPAPVSEPAERAST